MSIITLVSEADYRSVNFKGVGGANETYSNAIKFDRYGNYGTTDAGMYRLDYDVDNNIYHLAIFDAMPGSDNTLISTTGTVIASFNATDKTMKLHENAKDLIGAKTYSISGNVPIAKFVNIILNNHENEIAGKNVFKLLRGISYFNNNAFITMTFSLSKSLVKSSWIRFPMMTLF